MSWIRRNWPDLLIVLFILALIAGFVVVLMGGSGRLFGDRSSVVDAAPVSTPVAASSTPDPAIAPAPGSEPLPDPADAPPVSGPDASSVDRGAASGVATTPPPAVTPTPAVPVRPPSAATQPTTPPASRPSEPSSEPAPAEVIPTIPAQPVEPPSRSSTAPAAPASPPAVTPPVDTAPVVRPTQPIQPRQTAPVVQPAPQVTPAPRVVPAQPTPRPAPTVRPSVQVSRAGVPTKSDYRISAGLYSDAASAGTVSAKIRALGYPTYVVPSKDDTQVVLVGPFSNRSEADRASSDISRVHQNLFVYAPSSETARPAASAPAAQTQGDPSSAPGSSTTPPQASPAAPASSGSAYLQVGAYRNQDSANAQLEQLRSSGYAPTLRTNADGLIRVLVGPYPERDLAVSKEKLASDGYSSFAVRAN